MVVRLGQEKIPHHFCTLSLFEGSFYHGLLHVKRPSGCGQLPLVIESEKPLCLARPETTLHDTPTDQTARIALDPFIDDEP